MVQYLRYREQGTLTQNSDSELTQNGARVREDNDDDETRH